MIGTEVIEHIKRLGESKDVVFDNCNGTVSDLRQVAEIDCDEPVRHCIVLDFEDDPETP